MDAQKREISEKVGARIRYLRRDRSLSQEELALRAGLNPAYYGQVERGTKCPTIDTLYKISKALDVSLPELVRTEALSVPSGTDDLLSRLPPDRSRQVREIVEKIVGLFQDP